MRPAIYIYMCGLVFVTALASVADETTPAFRDVESEELSEKLCVADDSIGGVTNKTLLKRIDQLEKRIAELDSYQSDPLIRDPSRDITPLEYLPKRLYLGRKVSTCESPAGS